MQCHLVCVVPLKLLISLRGYLTALQVSFWLLPPLRAPAGATALPFILAPGLGSSLVLLASAGDRSVESAHRLLSWALLAVHMF